MENRQKPINRPKHSVKYASAAKMFTKMLLFIATVVPQASTNIVMGFHNYRSNRFTNATYVYGSKRMFLLRRLGALFAKRLAFQ
jgi:hypothetical protein